MGNAPGKSTDVGMDKQVVNIGFNSVHFLCC